VIAVVQVGHMDMAVVDSSYIDYVNKVVDIAAAVAAAAVVSYLAFLSACFFKCLLLYTAIIMLITFTGGLSTVP